MNYNPMLEYQRNQLLAQQAMIQNQLSQLNQMTPQIQMNQPVNVPANTQYFVKEINGFEEAKRIVPNLGQIYVLINSKDGKIYLKQINPDTGRSDYLFYNIGNAEESTEKDPITLIGERLTNIEKAIGDMRNESVSGNAAVPEPCEKPDERALAESARADEGTESANVSAGSANDKRKK